MKTAGIVAEYNPFHNGHAHHIERTRAIDGLCRATHVVAVMSGNFVQRGEPALLPKADRVRAALAGGVDLVLELPLPWAIASAESFAFGAVAILDALGCVDVLSFGSECGDIAPLEKAADALLSERFAVLLRYHLAGGISFPEARQRAAEEIIGKKAASVLDSANNTLGIEYLKALRRLGSSTRPFTIPRLGAGHDGPLPIGDMASASFLRGLLTAGRMANAAPYIPPVPLEILYEAAKAGRCPATAERIDRAMLSALRRLSKEQIARLPGISEGLENRIYEAIRNSGSMPELENAVKTKRYPLTRIRRILLAGFLGLSAGWEARKPPYIRVLGVGEKGAEILNAAKGASLPLVTRVSQLETFPEDARRLFALEARAADLYALALPTPLTCGTEYTNGMIRWGDAARS